MESITRIEARLKRDLLKVYSEIEIYPEDSPWDILESIFIEYKDVYTRQLSAYADHKITLMAVDSEGGYYTESGKRGLFRDL